MDENNEYTYHNGIAYASDDDEKNQEKSEKKKNRSDNSKFIIIQSVLCALIIAAVLVLKSTGSDLYVKIKEWYTENINKSVLIDYDGKDVKKEILEIFEK